jgi:predicted metal-dependent hydrolase
MMFFRLNEIDLPVFLVHDEFQSTRIRVNETGIFVKTHARVKALEVMSLLKKKEAWILKAYTQALKLKVLQEKVYYLNQEITVDIYESRRFNYKLDRNHLVIYKSNKLSLEKALHRFYLSEAQKWVVPILVEEAQRLNLKYQKHQFRVMRNAWGRCSSLSVITLNPKLMTCDLRFIRYVCIHELTHLTHMNHSKHFYALLGEYMPDFLLAKNLTPFPSLSID